MNYISSLSGGVSSAIATDLIINKYGRNKVKIFFADTNHEDSDLYRFINDLMKRWGGRLYVHKDGRNPLEVAQDRQIMPNNMIAPCTYELKIKPFEKWLIRQPKPVTVIMGFGWHEQHRIDSRQHYTKKHSNNKLKFTGNTKKERLKFLKKKWKQPTGYQQRFFGVYEDCPLLWKPLILKPFDYVKEVMGVEIPQAYKDGFGHNNCLGKDGEPGGCLKGGIKYWLKMKNYRPDNFAGTSTWETWWQAANDGKLANNTILRQSVNGEKVPLPLRELYNRRSTQASEADALQMDMFNCVCGV
jgi:hypothetical protein